MNALGKSAFSKADTRADEKIAFYALAVLVNLILVVGLFTASVAGSHRRKQSRTFTCATTILRFRCYL